MALIEARGLGVEIGGKSLLSGIDLAVDEGRGLALLGASGSGKTTLLQALVGAVPITAGEVRFRGEAASGRGRGRAGWSPLRREVQLVWQAADAALDPRWIGADALLEAARRAGRSPTAAQIDAILDALELDRGSLERRCDRLSGGQQQRLTLARALLAEPALLLADEPTSAVDAPLTAAVHRLLSARRAAGLAVVLATHDLTFAAGIADEVLVLERGGVVERGPLDQVARFPAHAATRALLAARATWDDAYA